MFCSLSSYNRNDAIVVKLVSIGNIEWAKTYVGVVVEGAMYLEQTPGSIYLVNVTDISYAKTCLYRINYFGHKL